MQNGVTRQQSWTDQSTQRELQLHESPRGRVTPDRSRRSPFTPRCGPRSEEAPEHLPALHVETFLLVLPTSRRADVGIESQSKLVRDTKVRYPKV